MFEALFGAEMPLAVRFFLAFLIVLGLIGGTAWAVRRFGAGRLGASSARGRQPRLAVIDYATVDTRRRLILVRRDNIEHLLMIGGPTDVVVESNIVRAAATATRDVPVARAPAAEALPRAMPLPEHGAWPLQPEPAPRAPPPARTEPHMAPHMEPHAGIGAAAGRSRVRAVRPSSRTAAACAARNARGAGGRNRGTAGAPARPRAGARADVRAAPRAPRRTAPAARARGRSRRQRRSEPC